MKLRDVNEANEAASASAPDGVTAGRTDRPARDSQPLKLVLFAAAPIPGCTCPVCMVARARKKLRAAGVSGAD